MYAQRLAAGLAELDAFRPTVIIDRPKAAHLPHMDHMVLGGGLIPGKLRRSKPVWPQLVGRAAAAAATGRYVVHGLSNFNIPLLSRDMRQRRVLTVHDVIPLLAPDSVSSSLSLQMRVLFGPAIAEAHRIICVSEWTRRTLVERFPTAAAKISVIRHGRPDWSFARKIPLADGVVQLLAVGRGERYKRLDLLVQMLRHLPETYRLTVVTTDAAVHLLRRDGSDLEKSGRLVLRTGVSDAALKQLYATAHVVLQPSLYEGYGLPIIEGLAHGCSVVFTAGTAMDEVLDRSVSVAMTPSAAAPAWAEAVVGAVAMSVAPDWETKARGAHDLLPTWKDVAQSVQTIYAELLR